ncbi:MAG: 50S ribosomal protein L15 [Salibacteraceae bacterium]|jgi:large subunit ribosomal protein L15|nr:50S ribosomal protein L15 [Salibacteraceae bacterium]MDP4686627.1 50S ribosomal protein L15 [Salibacteraceae bacterium]MDP4764167.1 50S ribosomal protein L15 [Salibacteraceae bacterium]MDP4843315.1 50S ribosomal protein L15 [Salibacteraceae bacterium]MDP4935078.1 50S ribosomal protein L15 [Salibacteraceae bacterium]
MDLSNLEPAKGSVKSKNKRLGRGEGSGSGGTASRGHKGAKSRSGYSKKIGFEGGQMPLQRRVPKFGFKNPNRVEYHGVNLDTIQRLAEENKVTEITPAFLREKSIIGKSDLIKILGRGEVSSKLTVEAHAFSKTAKENIEAKGGSTKVIG